MFTRSSRNALSAPKIAGAILVLAAIVALVAWNASRDASTSAPATPERTVVRAARPPIAPHDAPRSRSTALNVTRQRGTAPLTLDPAPRAPSDAEPTILGVVADAAGGPIAGAHVAARDGARVIASTLSDEAGAFALAVPAGSVVLVARAEAYSEANEWVRVPARGVQLILAPAASLSGRVLRAGQAVAIAGLDVIAEGPEGSGVALRVARTDGDGRFSFDALAPGRYQLEARGPEWRSQRRSESVAVGEQRNDIELEALPAGVLEARVLSEGEPCADGFVRLGGPAWSNTAVQHGRARVEGVLPGTYTAEVGCAASLTLSEPLELGLGHAQRTWDLSAGLRLSGRVETAAGEPLAGAGVRVLPKVGSGGVNVDCRSDAGGDFECRGLVAGPYRVEAVGPISALSDPLELDLDDDTDGVVLRAEPFGTIVASLANEPDGTVPEIFVRRAGEPPMRAARGENGELVFEQLPLGSYTVFVQSDRPSPGDSSVVLLERADQIARVTLHPPRTRALEGRVVDGDGSPVIDAWVSATSSAGALASVVTDSEGRFSIAGALPDVRYDVRVESSGGEALIAAAEPGRELLARVQRAAEIALVPAGLAAGTPFEVAYRGRACASQRGTLRDSSAGSEWRSPSLCPGRWQFLIWTADHCALTEIQLEAGARQRQVVALDAGDADACKAFWSAEATAAR